MSRWAYAKKGTDLFTKKRGQIHFSQKGDRLIFHDPLPEINLSPFPHARLNKSVPISELFGGIVNKLRSDDTVIATEAVRVFKMIVEYSELFKAPFALFGVIVKLL